MTLKDQILRFEPGCKQESEDRLKMLELLQRETDLLFRSNLRAHFTASAWIVNPAKTHALMVYHNLYDSWSWTGGHADGDKDLLAVALREAMEETGIPSFRPLRTAPISLEILSVQSHMRRGIRVDAHHHLNLTYFLMADEDRPLTANPRENSAIKWFRQDEIPGVVSEPHMLPIYRKLIHRASQPDTD